MLDAFRLWDFDRSGGLSGPELYGGLEWLGVHLEQVQMKEIMTRIDYDSDGYISFSEFQATLTNGVELDDGEEEADIAALIAEDEAEARETGVAVKKTAFSSALQIQPKSMGEHAHFIDGRAVGPEITVVEEITAQQMALIRIKIKPITRFDEVSFHSSPPIIYFCSFAALLSTCFIDAHSPTPPSSSPFFTYAQLWTSKGSMSRTKMSVWAPDTKYSAIEKARRKNKRLICIGHYAIKNFKKPGKRLVVEVMDSTKLAGVRGSKFIDRAVEELFPHPARFHQVWSEPRAATPFFTWEPVPPSDEFVAMGMVASNSETPPPVECVRCVPRKFTKESEVRAATIWQDSGAGRSGSVWHVNDMQLLVITEGHEKPENEHLDFLSKEFKATDY